MIDILDKLKNCKGIIINVQACNVKDLNPGDMFILAGYNIDSTKYVKTRTIDTYDGSPMCVNLSDGSTRYFDECDTVIKIELDVKGDSCNL